MIRTASILVVALVGCGGSPGSGPGHTSGPGPAPARTIAEPAPPDQGVREGDGWTRNERGWSFAIDGDRKPDIELYTGRSGARIVRIDLPAGATSARIETIRVDYISPGQATWTIATGFDTEQPVTLAAIDVEVVGGKSVEFIEHTVGADVRGPFWLVFTGRQGTPTIAAVNGTDTGRLWFRPTAGTSPRPTAGVPLIRVSLSDVRGPAGN